MKIITNYIYERKHINFNNDVVQGIQNIIVLYIGNDCGDDSSQLYIGEK